MQVSRMVDCQNCGGSQEILTRGDDGYADLFQQHELTDCIDRLATDLDRLATDLATDIVVNRELDRERRRRTAAELADVRKEINDLQEAVGGLMRGV